MVAKDASEDTPPDQAAVLDYAGDIARQLATLASASGAHALSTLFGAAAAEAARLKEAQSPADRNAAPDSAA